MLKDLKKQLCGDIGLVVLSGLGNRRTHPDLDGPEDAQHRPQCIPLSIPRVRSCGRGRQRETRGAGGLNGGAKRLWRSSWERGTRERVARGRVRLLAGRADNPRGTPQVDAQRLLELEILG
jgi:hypothetical protein